MRLNKSECNYLDITRFIGIFLVVLGHIPLIYNYNFINYMIYSFHMPLFIFISGILHRDTRGNVKAVIKLCYNLLVPLLIYNIIALLLQMLMAKNFSISTDVLYNLFTGQSFPSMATWFLMALFWIKFISLFIHSNKIYLIVTIVCLSFISIDKYFNLSLPNFYMIKSACFSFPFFWLGFIFRSYVDRINNLVKILIIVLSVPLSYLTVTRLTSISIAEVFYYNLWINIPLATLCCLSVIFISQYITPFIKCNFVKDISRGTMLILGLHTVVFFTLLTPYFLPPQPLRVAIVKAIATLLLFYPLIKLTYNSFPILYGKKKG